MPESSIDRCAWLRHLKLIDLFLGGYFDMLKFLIVQMLGSAGRAEPFVQPERMLSVELANRLLLFGPSLPNAG